MAGCLRTRRWLLEQPGGTGLPRITVLSIIALVVAGALLAEWTAVVIGYPASATLLRLVLARAAVLGATALVSAVLLGTAARFARLRAELRTRTEIERQLQEAVVAADQANRAKSDFLAVMSHEIRTPLNAVMGFANLLVETRLDESQRGYVNTITSEGARLGALINDILDLTKIEQGRLMLERLPFAPVDTTSEVLRLFSARALERTLELRFEAQIAGPLLVSGDPLRFRQILVNLVDNAIKFTPRGSVTVFLAWSPPSAGAAPHGRLAVRVRDTGIGIPEERRKDLFQMFSQVDSSTTRRYGGTGLGLAICHRLVALMGGEITVTSTQGEGTEFSFALPMTSVAAPDFATTDLDLPATRQITGARILVVDDMETNRFLLQVFLRRNGFIPDLASGGEEAVRLATENRYDAILMDLHMPDVDGFEATRRIRAAEGLGRHTPIIALTATMAKGTREKCFAAGMDEHMTKPLDLNKFKQLLTTLLGDHPNREMTT